MIRALLLLLVLIAFPVFAQEVPDAGAAPALDSPVQFLHVAFVAVKSGNWWAAASALLVLVVSLIRLYGKKLHDMIPDESIWDKPLWFIFETKAGGYLLNMATAIAGGVGTALLTNEAVTWDLVKPIVMVSVTGTALWEIAKDVWTMVQKKAVPAPAAAPAAAEPPKQ